MQSSDLILTDDIHFKISYNGTVYVFIETLRWFDLAGAN